MTNISKKRFTCPDSDISIIEVGDDFITIFLRQCPTKEQTEKDIVEQLGKVILPHNAGYYHQEEDWPLWAKRDTLHYHMAVENNLKSVLSKVSKWTTPKFRKEVLDGCKLLQKR